MLIFEGKEIETDTEGYLSKESSQWVVAGWQVIAGMKGFRCHAGTGKWCVLLRDFYLIQYFSGDSYAGKSDGE